MLVLMPYFNLVLSELDDGRIVQAHVGDRLTVTLPRNDSTGYQWSIKHADSAIVRMTESHTLPPEFSAAIVGSAGRVEFLFDVVAAGEGWIELKKWRHWEGSSSVVRRFRISLRISW